MIFESTNPLTSRDRFKSRTVLNLAIIAAIFIASVVVLSWFASLLFSGFLPLLLVDAACIAGAYYLYILWDKRPIRLQCPECGRIILSNTPWVCGVCKQPNRNTTDYPFVHRCEHEDCRAEPKAYKCHLCNELLFLSEDEDKTNYAHCLNSPDEIPEPDERVEKLKKVGEKKQDKADKIELAELDERLRAIRKRLKVEKKKSAKEVLKADVDSMMELEEAAIALKAEITEECKGDKARLKRRLLTVDKCFRRQMGEE